MTGDSAAGHTTKELSVAHCENRGYKHVAQCLQRWGPLGFTMFANLVSIHFAPYRHMASIESLRKRGRSTQPPSATYVAQ